MPPLRGALRQGRLPRRVPRAGCPFVYSYEAWGHTYVGCMQKVYDVEIDLDMLRAAERRQAGFGAIRAMRQPLPMCQRRGREHLRARAPTDTGCINPEFGELPVGEPTFRVFAQIKNGD